MSEAVITKGKLYLAQYDLSSEMNAIAAEMSAEARKAPLWWPWQRLRLNRGLGGW